MSLKLLSLMLCVFGITTGEFVIAGILPDVAADLDVSIPRPVSWSRRTPSE